MSLKRDAISNAVPNTIPQLKTDCTGHMEIRRTYWIIDISFKTSGPIDELCTTNRLFVWVSTKKFKHESLTFFALAFKYKWPNWWIETLLKNNKCGLKKCRKLITYRRAVEVAVSCEANVNASDYHKRL